MTLLHCIILAHCEFEFGPPILDYDLVGDDLTNFLELKRQCLKSEHPNNE